MNSTPEQRTGQRALLRFLQRQDRLSPDDAARVESLCAAGQVTAHEVLEREGIITQKDLAVLLATTLGLRTIDLTTYPLDPQVAREIKENLATRYRLLPVASSSATIDVATSNPLDLEALKVVEFATGKRVQPLVTTEVEVRDAIQHAFRLQESLEQFLQHVPGDGQLTVTELVSDSGDLRTIARDAELPPVVKLADLILIEAIKSRSSDVHVEPGTDTALVRYRVDGILEEAFRFPKWVQNPLIARLKIMARLDITERRVPQDGRIQLRYQDKLVDLRVSSLPSQHGEKITLRILDASTGLQVLDRLGLNARYLSILREMIRRPQGMILITGPTGSGKTTTLYAVLREIFSPNISIVTIEDPVEYQLKGINQVEVNEKQGRSFAGILRSVLRQDPDVILIGEIRDRDTAQIAFQAAATGHLVLTTVHTNDAAGAVTRLVDLGLDPRAIAATLNLVVAQRLVRRVCAGCSAPVPLDEETRRALRLPVSLREEHRGEGCLSCRQSGYAGRLGVYEFLPITPSVAKLLEGGSGESAIRQQARLEGFGAVLDDAVEKLAAGATTAEEILRVVQVKEEVPHCPGCLQEIAEDYAVCPHCGRVLRADCAACGKPLQPGWTTCPYCRTAVPGAGGMDAVVGSAPPAEPRTFRALVVDDTEAIRDIVRAVLERSDLKLTVVAAGDGAEALAMAARERPDVVILDISMPDMDGFEVCRRLRSEVRTAFVPVLMLTAHDSEDFIARGFGVGADDYMIKPFRREDLVARIRRMLDRTYGSGVGRALAQAPPAEAVPAKITGIDPVRLEALDSEVADVARAHDALVARLAACEARLTELAAARTVAGETPLTQGDPGALAPALDEARRLLEGVRVERAGLVAALQAEQTQALQHLRAELAQEVADARAEAVAARRATEAVAERAARLEQQKRPGGTDAVESSVREAVERLTAEQAALAAALAALHAAQEESAQRQARAGDEWRAAAAAQAESATAREGECERRLATLTARLDELEAGSAGGGEVAAETAKRLNTLQDALEDLRGAQQATAKDLRAAQAKATKELRAAQKTTAEELSAAHAEATKEMRAAQQATAEDARTARAVAEELRTAHARATDELRATQAAQAEAATAREGECQRQVVALATRLDELELGRATGGEITAELAGRLTALQDAIEELRAGQGAAAEDRRAARERLERLAAHVDADAPERERLGALINHTEVEVEEVAARLERESGRLDALVAVVDGCEAQLSECAGRLDKDLVRRDALMALIDGGEAQLTELAERLQRDSARLDTLLAFVDGCETQLSEFAGRLDKDLVRRDALMALIDGCEAQLTELAARLTGGVVGTGETPTAQPRPIVDLQERIRMVNAMLAENTEEGPAPVDPATALRLRSQLFGQLRRQVEQLRAGSPWEPGVRKTLALLVDSTLAATIAPIVRGVLDITGIADFFGARSEDPPDVGDQPEPADDELRPEAP